MLNAHFFTPLHTFELLVSTSQEKTFNKSNILLLEITSLLALFLLITVKKLNIILVLAVTCYLRQVWRLMNQLTISNLESPQDTKEVKPIFARHETFHPRFGWLKKGFDLVTQDPGIFQRDDAPIRLGVGKNMVRSIRYWCNTFKVLSSSSPSNFGSKLFADKGWDSFLEDPASLWLLHWNLLKPTCEAAAWYFTFFEFKKVEFTTDELLKELNEWQQTFTKQVVESSLKKDISCILRMYGSEEGNKSFLEDSIDSPFQQLGIIQNLGSKGYKPHLG